MQRWGSVLLLSPELYGVAKPVPRAYEKQGDHYIYPKECDFWREATGDPSPPFKGYNIKRSLQQEIKPKFGWYTGRWCTHQSPFDRHRLFSWSPEDAIKGLYDCILPGRSMLNLTHF